jgi:hypothetical protein
MELTKEQLIQIDNYIYVCGIKYYDVRTEIVDHFANILEQKLDENPDLDLKKEIENIHRNFSNKGFSKLLKEKTKSVTKKFYNQSLKHLVTFFKLPKIIITVALFYLLIQTMSLFKEKNTFFLILSGIGLLLSLIIIRNGLGRFKLKEKFLVLGMTMNFYQIFYLVVVFLQLFNNRSEDSFANLTHNYWHIAGYVLMFLFFWSGEYVYHQNKKEVQKLYPHVIV